MENSWTDHVRKEDVLHLVNKGRNILHTVRRMTSWIDHIWRRNCLLRHVTEGKIWEKSDDKTSKKTQIAAGWP
jgi:hypothetical protein